MVLKSLSAEEEKNNTLQCSGLSGFLQEDEFDFDNRQHNRSLAATCAQLQLLLSLSHLTSVSCEMNYQDTESTYGKKWWAKS